MQLYLEDLFVHRSYATTGIGTAVMTPLIEIAQARNDGRVEWKPLDWNELAIKFYCREGRRHGYQFLAHLPLDAQAVSR